MNKRVVIRQLIVAVGLSILACLSLPGAVAAETGPSSDEEKPGPKMRFLCLDTLPAGDEVMLASRNEEGEWIEHGSLSLRPTFITSWQKAATGTLHLAKREGEGLVSLGSFRLKEGVKRSIVVLMPNKAKGKYQADVIDPEEFGFRKGMTLVTNYSKVPALVMLGKKKAEVMPGKRVAARAAVGDDGMYRMLVGYTDAQKELIPCYDRYISSNPDARDILLLFPDSTTGLKVYSLSEFGPFE